MAVTITDVTISAATLGINGVTVNNAAVVLSTERDRGANAEVGSVTVLLSVDSFAGTPTAGGYMRVRLLPLSATGGTLYDDGPGGAVIPVTASALYDAPAILIWPPGCQFAKVEVGNFSGQNTAANAVTATLKYQRVTV